MQNTNSAAQVTGVRGFMANGNWAAQRFFAEAKLKGIKALSPGTLRTNEVLTRDEWKVFDNEIIAEAEIRLRAVADLISLGLTKNIPNGLAKTVLEYQTIGDMDDAIVSLDGVTRSMNDRPEFGEAGIPLPITHKDFYINLRTLLASRTSGEPLDTTYVRIAGRKVAEATENMLFNGGPTFGGLPIYGYTTHPDRMISGFSGGIGWNNAAKTGAQIATDVGTMLTAFESQNMPGPYGIYVGSGGSLKMQEDYKTESDRTIRERVLAFDNISFLRVVDKLAPGSVVMVQLTPDVVQLVQGEPVQTVQWDVHGGFQINFKVMAIMVPLIRATSDGQVGVYHMS
jgi:hypothetical protein